MDLGCGYGWHCKYAVEQGAAQVLGIDISRKMLDEAQRRNTDPKIEYRLCGIKDYDYPAAAWDCVVSSLGLHYIADLDRVFVNVHRTLKPSGTFLFNIEHPSFTAGVHQDWVYSADGQPLYWPIDDYFLPGERVTNFLGCEVRKQHHTLTQILVRRVCAGCRRRGRTARQHDGPARHERRAAPPDDAAGESNCRKRSIKIIASGLHARYAV